MNWKVMAQIDEFLASSTERICKVLGECFAGKEFRVERTSSPYRLTYEVLCSGGWPILVFEVDTRGGGYYLDVSRGTSDIEYVRAYLREVPSVLDTLARMAADIEGDA